MADNSKEWFGEWFNSPFYHILYKHRDFEEAESFINRLSVLMNFKSGQKALDAACGRGRHAIYLQEKGLNVTGIDLSEESIAFASRYKNENLKFFVHDIRKNFKREEFDFILNLFTSFGYFEEEEDNYKTISAFSDGLKKGGKLVLDFMNTERTLRKLISAEETEIEGIKFCITRKVENNFIVKKIRFTAENEEFEFYEKVRMICKEDFLKYFNFAGLSVVHLFGDYQLGNYSQKESERMIFIVTKN